MFLAGYFYSHDQILDCINGSAWSNPEASRLQNLLLFKRICPLDEHTIVKPPIGCPFSKTCSYWKLKKSLYGLCHAPRRWYNKIRPILESLGLGLRSCPHDPCLFHGTVILGKPPLYVAIHVDDIIFLSPDDAVEQYFTTALSQKIKVKFLGDTELYIGIKFDWHKFPDSIVSC